MMGRKPQDRMEKGCYVEPALDDVQFVKETKQLTPQIFEVDDGAVLELVRETPTEGLGRPTFPIHLIDNSRKGKKEGKKVTKNEFVKFYYDNGEMLDVSIDGSTSNAIPANEPLLQANRKRNCDVLEDEKVLEDVDMLDEGNVVMLDDESIINETSTNLKVMTVTKMWTEETFNSIKSIFPNFSDAEIISQLDTYEEEHGDPKFIVETVIDRLFHSFETDIMPSYSKDIHDQVDDGIFITHEGPSSSKTSKDSSNSNQFIKDHDLWFNKEDYAASGLQYMSTKMKEVEYECGCCFCEYEFTGMTQCEEGHLFCLKCARMAAQNVIGQRKIELKCLCSSEKCPYSFADAEIQRFLPENEYIAFHQLCQEINISQANIPGFESCPFCSFGTIIPPEDQEVLFRCEREDCKIISCRKCKKKDHTPEICEDMVADAVHNVAEAMTKALMRKCPKCGVNFFKTEGCNKMTCSCGHKICYICRKPIADYNHFYNSGQPAAGKCPLWDNTEQRNQDEAIKAGKDQLAIMGIKNDDVSKLIDKSSFPTVRPMINIMPPPLAAIPVAAPPPPDPDAHIPHAERAILMRAKVELLDLRGIQNERFNAEYLPLINLQTANLELLRDNPNSPEVGRWQRELQEYRQQAQVALQNRATLMQNPAEATRMRVLTKQMADIRAMHAHLARPAAQLIPARGGGFNFGGPAFQFERQAAAHQGPFLVGHPFAHRRPIARPVPPVKVARPARAAAARAAPIIPVANIPGPVGARTRSKNVTAPKPIGKKKKK